MALNIPWALGEVDDNQNLLTQRGVRYAWTGTQTRIRIVSSQIWSFGLVGSNLGRCGGGR